jgi:hypothetical protein
MSMPRIDGYGKGKRLTKRRQVREVFADETSSDEEMPTREGGRCEETQSDGGLTVSPVFKTTRSRGRAKKKVNKSPAKQEEERFRMDPQVDGGQVRIIERRG